MTTKLIYPQKENVKMVQNIIKAVSEVWGLTTEQILQPTRGKANTTFARHLCMALAYRITSLTMTQIAEAFRRDYTSVIYAIKKVDQASNDKELAPLIREVLNKIK